MNTGSQDNSDVRDKIELTDPLKLYEIKNEAGHITDYENASGRQLFNHYRHNMTNYDQVLDNIHDEQGYVQWSQQKQASVGAAEKILELYRDEHVKVIKDSQNKGNFIRSLMNRLQVTTTTALVNVLDSWAVRLTELSSKIGENEDHIDFLKDSQGAYHRWNNTYRVQKFMVLKMLEVDGVDKPTIAKIEQIYGTKSVNRAVELAQQLFDLEESEILKYFIKPAVRELKRFAPKS
jgi:hypothetical protein